MDYQDPDRVREREEQRDRDARRRTFVSAIAAFVLGVFFAWLFRGYISAWTGSAGGFGAGGSSDALVTSNREMAAAMHELSQSLRANGLNNANCGCAATTPDGQLPKTPGGLIRPQSLSRPQGFEWERYRYQFEQLGEPRTVSGLTLPGTSEPGYRRPARAGWGLSQFDTGETSSTLVSRPATALNTRMVTIAGTARTSTNSVLPGALLRLRDARTGSIFSQTTADNMGAFAFENVPPGTYVVEMIGGNATSGAASVITSVSGAVMSTSSVISADAGEIISTVVRLPLQAPMAAVGAIGNLASSLTTSSLAAATGVTGVAVVGDPVSQGK